MDLGPTLVNAFVVVAVGAILTYVTSDRLRGIRNEMHELKTDLARVEARLDAGIAAVRSDVMQVALAVGARPEAPGARAT